MSEAITCSDTATQSNGGDLLIVELRYYKRFDLDLLSLMVSGINLNAYLPAVLQGYAKGEPVKLIIPFCKEIDSNGIQMLRAGIKITDPASISLLEGIKRGYRNAFCKMILRESLMFQALGVYFSRRSLIEKENERIHLADIDNVPNHIICKPEKRTKSYAAKVLGNKAVKPTRKKTDKQPEAVRQIEESSINPEPVKESTETLKKNPTPVEPPNDDTVPGSSDSDLLSVFKSMMQGGEN